MCLKQVHELKHVLCLTPHHFLHVCVKNWKQKQKNLCALKQITYLLHSLCFTVMLSVWLIVFGYFAFRFLEILRRLLLEIVEITSPVWQHCCDTSKEVYTVELSRCCNFVIWNSTKPNYRFRLRDQFYALYEFFP